MGGVPGTPYVILDRPTSSTSSGDTIRKGDSSGDTNPNFSELGLVSPELLSTKPGICAKRGASGFTLGISIQANELPNPALQRTRPVATVSGTIGAHPRRAGPLSFFVGQLGHTLIVHDGRRGRCTFFMWSL